MTELPLKVYELLTQRYVVLDVIAFLDFDEDFDILKSKLSAIKKEEFHHDDRIIIEHLDTDYYFDHCDVGVNLRNFFLVVQELDIPGFVFVFYTNHFGLKKEIDLLFSNFHPNDRPTIIESFLSTLHHDPTKIKDIEYNFDSVKHNALCMMNLKRSHRCAVYHALKNISPDALALNVTVPRVSDASE